MSEAEAWNLANLPTKEAHDVERERLHGWSAGVLGTPLPCTVHRTHEPRSHVNHFHHVWPLGRGGPDSKANQIVVCPTGHYNIHKLLDKAIKEGVFPDWDFRRRFNRVEVTWARLGFDRYLRGAM